jgi:hypothetical protein
MKQLPVERMKMQMQRECAAMTERLSELLFAPESAPADLRAHAASCAHCQAELNDLRATMDLLDAWETPEPNPYFMTRMEARLREEQEAEPAWWGARWMARLRERALLGAASHVRPLAAMAMTITLLVGGGAYLGVTDWDQEKAPEGRQAAVVHDLQTMDSNAQLLDQLEAMSSANDNEE